MFYWSDSLIQSSIKFGICDHISFGFHSFIETVGLDSSIWMWAESSIATGSSIAVPLRDEMIHSHNPPRAVLFSSR